MGININTVPVLDLLQSSTHTIIQERSYSSNLKTIKHLGKFCISFFKDKKIGTVAKHAPGHGSANADSHKKLPIVYKSSRHLYKNDGNVLRKCTRRTDSIYYSGNGKKV